MMHLSQARRQDSVRDWGKGHEQILGERKNFNL